LMHGDTERHVRCHERDLVPRLGILVHIVQVVRTRTLEEIPHRRMRNPYCGIFISHNCSYNLPQKSAQWRSPSIARFFNELF
jgi:hypothetical protein